MILKLFVNFMEEIQAALIKAKVTNAELLKEDKDMTNIYLDSKGDGVSLEEIREALRKSLKERMPIKKALILPPDISRSNSFAGPITRMLIELLEGAVIHIMPALGTHTPMTDLEIDEMYEGIPKDMFLVHNWRSDIKKIGEVPADFVSSVSEGYMNQPIDVEINTRVLDPEYDIIISVGQVVPHEVVGMANYNKNLFVGCGGSSMINLSHYLGALYGMERMMGRADTPVRRVFNYAEEKFLSHIPLMYVLTVTTKQQENIKVENVSIGRGYELFEKAAAVSVSKNLTILDKPLKKVVVYLDPHEFKTTWIGNKSIYRTRMAIEDDGELIIIAPGVHGCGEDMQNDKLIRKYGYVKRDEVLKIVAENEDIRNNLSVAAHLIHGTSDGRFKITYAPGGLTKEEVESLGYNYMPLDKAMEMYDVNKLENGFNTVGKEEIFYVSNPALGLWAYKGRFYNSGDTK